MTTYADADGHHTATFWSRFGQRDGHGLYRSVTFLTLFSLLFGGLLLMVPVSAGAQSTATTTDSLNLRTGPGTDTSIITVMPYGASVSVNGDAEIGFYPVSYNGYAGYASGDYLSIGGGGSSGVATDGATGTAYVIDGRLNLRSGASTSHGVLTVMEDGAAVSLTGEYSNGFLGIVYNGTSGFAHSDYLSTSGAAPAPAPAPGSGSVAVGDTVVNSGYVNTDALNLRSGPGTSHSVIAVMYSGAELEIMGDPQAGFYPIRHNGTKGWASGDFVAIGTPAPTTPAPAPGSGNTDIVSIIYASADRYGQPRADMLRVAKCESVLDPNAINPYSNASGLFQFLPGTWATTPFADQDIFDAEANANAAGWMWSVGRRNEWTCQ